MKNVEMRIFQLSIMFAIESYGKYISQDFQKTTLHGFWTQVYVYVTRRVYLYKIVR